MASSVADAISVGWFMPCCGEGKAYRRWLSSAVVQITTF